MRVIIDQTLVIWLVTISFDHNVLQKSAIARQRTLDETTGELVTTFS